MESRRDTARPRPGHWNVDRVVATPAWSPRLRIRGRWQREGRPRSAARRGRRLWFVELGRAGQRERVMMRVGVVALVLAMATGTRIAAQEPQPDRTLPAQLSASTRATLERLID